MDLPGSEPINLRAGDTISWERELAEYSAADGWALKYRLLWPTGPAVDITSTGSGTTHTVSLTAVTTASYAPGTATLLAYVERTGERVTLDVQTVTVLPDLTASGPYDSRSLNQIALANARAALASYMAKGQLHVAGYDIGGRVMKFREAKDIIDLIQHLEREVAREVAAIALLSGRSPGRVAVRF